MRQLSAKVREIDRKNLIKTALACKKVFDKYKLQTFIKTSGKAGLHIFIPCSGIAYGDTRTIAETIAEEIHKLVPTMSTIADSPDHRQGKVYIDPSQNDYSDRVAVAYCIRAHKQPTVSTPLFWDEVNDKLDVKKFRYDMILQRLEEKGDPWERLLNKAVTSANNQELKRLL